MRLTANEVGPLNGLGGSNPLVSANRKIPHTPRVQGIFALGDYLPGFTGATGFVGSVGLTGAVGFTGTVGCTGRTGAAPRAVTAVLYAESAAADAEWNALSAASS